ncbi:MAG: hypothetical protein LKF96_11040 [Treponema sp.]|nr:hypothetical protein [Treponema sp.]
MKRFAAFFLIMTGACLYAADSGVSWGAAGAKNERDLSVPAMLKYAIEDEFLARAEYDRIIKKFGKIRPFSSIIKAEERHIQWLKDEYKNRSLPVPDDRAADFVIVPGSVKEALEAGVTAEIENIAMYRSFLADPELSVPENRQLKDLFTRLMQASENHLAAFRRNLDRS